MTNVNNYCDDECKKKFDKEALSLLENNDMMTTLTTMMQ